MTDDGIEYLRAHAEPLAPEGETTSNCWLSRIEGTAQLSGEQDRCSVDDETHEPND
ncbi:hypothetical protein C481_02982 [Natrialba asiatica DSM 12278]|uniref:Uncharacterized protein n=1 Tax=Natrialba asiatica (strain ATCC 700177 / DSM 12278 / JCM 9576 / FERM P-10747 / NBRC 102637 / 172P1) TaxID=29540 RepID=M0B2V4_NATA1|nr:hypothetical protein C481_02982 [Natrialba asiatica DSM 12278]